MLFFGLEDDEKEKWDDSEQKIITFCAQKLDVTITESHFERVHRLGKFALNKRRPIVAKLAFFKDKQRILASAHKLKGSTYSIREDFSVATRLARRKLLEFAKMQDKRGKLVFDKLLIDQQTYVYDSATDTVIAAAR